VQRRRTEQRLNEEQERQGSLPEGVVEFGRGLEESCNAENREETIKHE
jgi:ADP-ribose pyrophosphatase YjhB (NUDIX family)